MVWIRTLLKGVAAVSGPVCVIWAHGTYYNEVKAAKRQPWPFHEPSVPWDSNWDKREPESLLKILPNEGGGDSSPSKEMLEKVKSKACRHLFLVRHGQYHMSNGNGDSSKCLTPLGHKQAALTGLRLKELSHPYNVLIKSTMTRATETADIISSHLPSVPVVSCDMIREGAPIPPEPPVGHWRPEAQFYEDGARIEAAFRKYFHRAEPTQTTDTYEIMVCHANVIRYFVCRALQFPPEAWLRLTLHNCSITWLVIHPSGRVVLKHLGDAGHIPADMLSTS